jgi:hypothetical protein
LDSAIRLLQLPTDETDADDEHFIDVEDTPGYQAAFCQLAMAGKKEFDPFKGDLEVFRLLFVCYFGCLFVSLVAVSLFVCYL